MKIGKISQTIRKRSVLKAIQHRKDQVKTNLGAEEACAKITLDEEKEVMTTCGSMFGDEKDLGKYLIAKLSNQMHAKGGDPMGVDLAIELPTHAYESRLKSMMTHIEECCATQDLEILSVKVTINPVVKSTLIFGSMLGILGKEKQLKTPPKRAGLDIVLIHKIGVEAGLRLLEAKEALRQRFHPSFFADLEKAKDQLSPVKEIRHSIDEGAVAIHQVGEGGILATLWELAEEANAGVEVWLKEIMIRQDVIEICECLKMNPYQMSSIGTLLVVIEDGNHLVEQLKREGIEATVIGITTDKNEKVICSGEEKRFIDRPAPDELLKIYEEDK